MKPASIPPDSFQCLEPRSKLNFFDQRSVTLPTPMRPIEAWNRIMSEPMPILQAAFKVRDTVSNWFGVKAIKGISNKEYEKPEIGDHLDFFLVEHSDDSILTLTARDTHLDVMTCISSHENTITITSSVITHNTFGRCYMIPVGPAHKIIVNHMFKRLSKQLTA